jgi:hypothetical protein
MLKQFLTTTILASAIIFSCQSSAATGTMGMEAKSMMAVASNTDPLQEEHKAMRKLWEDHITFTRNYIISAIGDLKDVDAVAERLMKNQNDIGDAIKPFYGAEAGEKLASLLRDHIKIATEVVTAAKKDNKTALETAQKKWNDNADDIANFLSAANSHWDKTSLTEMLHKHLDLTTGEATSRLKKDWKADIDYYDKGHEHMLMFSDMLVDGIAQQFPEKFSMATRDSSTPTSP